MPTKQFSQMQSSLFAQEQKIQDLMSEIDELNAQVTAKDAKIAQMSNSSVLHKMVSEKDQLIYKQKQEIKELEGTIEATTVQPSVIAPEEVSLLPQANTTESFLVLDVSHTAVFPTAKMEVKFHNETRWYVDVDLPVAVVSLEEHNKLKEAYLKLNPAILAKTEKRLAQARRTLARVATLAGQAVGWKFPAETNPNDAALEARAKGAEPAVSGLIAKFAALHTRVGVYEQTLQLFTMKMNWEGNYWEHGTHGAVLAAKALAKFDPSYEEANGGEVDKVPTLMKPHPVGYTLGYHEVLPDEEEQLKGASAVEAITNEAAVNEIKKIKQAWTASDPPAFVHGAEVAVHDSPGLVADGVQAPAQTAEPLVEKIMEQLYASVPLEHPLRHEGVLAIMVNACVAAKNVLTGGHYWQQRVQVGHWYAVVNVDWQAMTLTAYSNNDAEKGLTSMTTITATFKSGGAMSVFHDPAPEWAQAWQAHISNADWPSYEVHAAEAGNTNLD